MVDEHCVRDGVGFIAQWLLRSIGLGMGCIQFREYVNHVVETAVRYPLEEVEMAI